MFSGAEEGGLIDDLVLMSETLTSLKRVEFCHGICTVV